MSMGGWGRSLSNLGGRFSSSLGRPWTSNAPPQVTDDDFSYITAEDLESPKRTYDPQDAPRQRRTDVGPDILVLKHRGVAYPMHFPGYSIDDGTLNNGALRERAALELAIDDPRRIKLLYKGRNLKDDHTRCVDEGLKLNSEILAVVSDPLEPTVDGESESGDEAPVQDGENGSAAGKRKRIRNKKKKGKKSAGATGGASSTTTAPAPPASSQPPPQPAVRKPTTPLEKLEDISSALHAQYVPMCQAFIASPPTEPAKLEFEHKRLSETLLAQVLLKLDGVETEGNPELRQRRKDLVRETQAVLASIDEVMH
ncbi:hypothetical protein L228DRAFT_268622 [Xylona heveae TC161]|uniref:BAG domain-containing protein n=1 Tax=Xylona heveae (strain CBS 132557 / TC161) TaxID=1328760 RepID=A0A165GFW1_XYLHT|nr:hypothetical protein L228DRAFT_268622 [Xylona heveae TC161]KZF22132.1 hypothetical protein L228DRAFT_268622 [Xylona heveae TC161]